MSSEAVTSAAIGRHDSFHGARPSKTLGQTTGTPAPWNFFAVPNNALWQDSPHPPVIQLDVRGIIDNAFLIGTWDRVLMTIWRGDPTIEAAQLLSKFGREFVAADRGLPICFLSVIESRSPPPSDKVRKELSAAFREFAPAMKHQIFVSEGSGFRGALVRGVGLTVSTLAPSLLPFKFAGSLDEAAVTLAPNLTARAGGSDGLKAAVAQFRQKLDERSSPAPGLRT